MDNQELQKKIEDLERLYFTDNFPTKIVQRKTNIFKKNISTGTGISFGETGEKIAFLGGTSIIKQNAITKPTGGTTVDTQARVAIDSLIDLIKNYGLSN